MTETHKHLEHLSEIRALMERSTRFLSLSGLSGVWAGLCALAGVAPADALMVGDSRIDLDAAQAAPSRYQPHPDWQHTLARHAEGSQTTQGAFDRPWK